MRSWPSSNNAAGWTESQRFRFVATDERMRWHRTQSPVTTDDGPGDRQVPDQPIRRTRRRRAPVLRRLLRHLRPRQRRRHRPGAAAVSRTSASTRRATSRPWCTPRSAFAKHSNRLRRLRLHLVHRPRRHQHDHRRGHGHDQPPARPAAARRHLRPPQRRPRPPTARIRAHARTSRSTTASSPSAATGTASTGPSRSSPRCPRPCAC